jgi:hypothetical protein
VHTQSALNLHDHIIEADWSPKHIFKFISQRGIDLTTTLPYKRQKVWSAPEHSPSTHAQRRNYTQEQSDVKKPRSGKTKSNVSNHVHSRYTSSHEVFSLSRRQRCSNHEQRTLAECSPQHRQASQPTGIISTKLHCPVTLKALNIKTHPR